MSKLLLALLVSFCLPVVALASSDLIDTAKAVKAMIHEGYELKTIVDVTTVERESTPPLRCILVVTDRKPNTECPNSPTGPNLDKGAVACFDSVSGEVVSVGGIESQCATASARSPILRQQ